MDIAVLVNAHLRHGALRQLWNAEEAVAILRIDIAAELCHAPAKTLPFIINFFGLLSCHKIV